MNALRHHIILIDALRHDYITAEWTPFLASLLPDAQRASVIETFAFQTRPAYFAGLEPDESSVCHLFNFDPESSPWRWCRVPFDSRSKVLRAVVKRTGRVIERAKGWQAAAEVLDTHQIPLPLLRFFAPGERIHTDTPGVFGDRKTFFDLCREQNKKVAWIGYPRHYGSAEAVVAAYDKIAGGSDIAYVHLSEVDWAGHRYGPDSEEAHDALRKVDMTVKKLVQPQLERGGKVMVFGDHGMVQVEYRIDLQVELRKLPLVIGKNYVVFIDSTQARFWFFSAEAERTVIDALSQLEGARFLSTEDRERLHITGHRANFGDAILVLSGPGIFHPSYFADRTSPLGMHGYVPEIRDNMSAMMMYPSAVEDLGIIAMVRLFEVMRGVLD